MGDWPYRTQVRKRPQTQRIGHPDTQSPPLRRHTFEMVHVAVHASNRSCAEASPRPALGAPTARLRSPGSALELFEAMTRKSRTDRSVRARPADRMPPSCSRPVSARSSSASRIQSLLAYTLLPEGRGSFALCVVFAGVLGVLFTPGGARRRAVFRHDESRRPSRKGVGAALAICLGGGALAVTLAIPFVHGDIAFFHKGGDALVSTWRLPWYRSWRSRAPWSINSPGSGASDISRCSP